LPGIEKMLVAGSEALSAARSLFRVCALALVTSCSPAPDSRSGDSVDDLGPEVEVLIDTEDAVIGQIADLVIAPDGTVYAVDRQAGQIHVVDPAGHRLPSLGRPGAGPGEFAEPTTLEVVGDTLYVVDGGNGRLQALSIEGKPILTRSLPPGQAWSIGAGTHFVRPTWGIDTMLAMIHRPDLAVIAPIGRIVGKPTNLVYPGRMKQEIREGSVPDIFLNTAEAVIGSDSSTWLCVPARGMVQRFDAAGREQWSVELDEPEREQLMAAFVAENAAMPTGSFAFLWYVLDITLVGDDAWVLLGNSLSGQAAVRVLSSDGTMGERLEFPGVTRVDEIAVDAERGWLYFARPDDAELIRVHWRPAA